MADHWRSLHTTAQNSNVCNLYISDTVITSHAVHVAYTEPTPKSPVTYYACMTSPGQWHARFKCIRSLSSRFYCSVKSAFWQFLGNSFVMWPLAIWQCTQLCAKQTRSFFEEWAAPSSNSFVSDKFRIFHIVKKVVSCSISEWRKYFGIQLNRVVRHLLLLFRHILPGVETLIFVPSFKCDVHLRKGKYFHDPSGAYLISCGISVLLFTLIMPLCMKFCTALLIINYWYLVLQKCQNMFLKIWYTV